MPPHSIMHYNPIVQFPFISPVLCFRLDSQLSGLSIIRQKLVNITEYFVERCVTIINLR